MMLQINKDTKIYGSFSTNPGNNGCLFFNKLFQDNNINAIYKSFYSDNVSDIIQSIKHLKFGGFALSMPHKISIIPYLSEIEPTASKIGAVNTVINKDGYLIGYNTDYMGVLEFFQEKNIKNHVNIIGNGGFSKAIQSVCNTLNIKHNIITRDTISSMNHTKNVIYINATPIDVVSEHNIIIDLRPHTIDGKNVARKQAQHQYKLYTENI
jgi:shikimate dehydrogenase